MTTQKKDFIPVLLGGDLNLYGMARSFYEITQKPVRVIASARIAPTKYSSILDIEYVPGFDTDPTFITKMREVAKEFENTDVPVILMGMGDWYTELISQNREELAKTFIVPYVDQSLDKDLENKESFYNICEKYNLPYPKTRTITRETIIKNESVELFDFPMVLKSVNSVSWNEFHSDIKEKVYMVETEADFYRIIKRIYADGYEDNMIIQEFVQGNESPMRVLNAYVDKNHQVKMMFLGNAVLEDPTPSGIGNYLGIIPDYNEEIFEQVKFFLEDIKYTGYANFDLKYDIKDNKYKFFEINLRQGRSSFFLTLNGVNLAEWLVRDYIYDDLKNDELLLVNIPKEKAKLWLNISVGTFKKYAHASKDKDAALKMIAEKRYGYTFYYEGDKNIKRYLLLQRMFRYYRKSFKKYSHLTGR